MAIRVTAVEVKEIMDNCTVIDSVVDNFIITASALVDKIFIGDLSITAVLLKEIEKWLTAHLLASTLSRTTSQEQIGDVSVKYTGFWKEGLSSTSYGQMVLILDTSGKMAKAGKMGASMMAVKSFED